MSDYRVDMNVEQMRTLRTRDVAFVLIVNEAQEGPLTYDYEQHVMKQLLPRLCSDGFSNVHSMWRTDPFDESIPLGYLRKRGYLDSRRYRAAHERIDAGEGVTSVVVILWRRKRGARLFAPLGWIIRALCGKRRHDEQEDRPLGPKGHSERTVQSIQAGQYFRGSSRAVGGVTIYGCCNQRLDETTILAQDVYSKRARLGDSGRIEIANIRDIISREEYDEARAAGWPDVG